MFAGSLANSRAAKCWARAASCFVLSLPLRTSPLPAVPSGATLHAPDGSTIQTQPVRKVPPCSTTSSSFCASCPSLVRYLPISPPARHGAVAKATAAHASAQDIECLIGNLLPLIFRRGPAHGRDQTTTDRPC